VKPAAYILLHNQHHRYPTLHLHTPNPLYRRNQARLLVSYDIYPNGTGLANISRRQREFFAVLEMDPQRGGRDQAFRSGALLVSWVRWAKTSLRPWNPVAWVRRWLPDHLRSAISSWSPVNEGMLWADFVNYRLGLE